MHVKAFKPSINDYAGEKWRHNNYNLLCLSGFHLTHTHTKLFYATWSPLPSPGWVVLFIMQFKSLQPALNKVMAIQSLIFLFTVINIKFCP